MRLERSRSKTSSRWILKTTLERSFVDAWDLFQPPPEETLSQYSERCRILSAESSAVPGLLSFTGAEYQIEMHDAISDSEVEIVVFIMPIQTGKSTVIENAILNKIDVDPSPILLVRPTLTDAQDFSRERLMPILRDNRHVHKKLADLKSRTTDNSLTFKRFAGGFIALTGANSPVGLSGRPVPFLILDEASRFPKTAGQDGDPFDIVMGRTTNFANRKIIIATTPVLLSDRALQEYNASDMRIRQICCPECGEWQVYDVGRFEFELETIGKKDFVLSESIRFRCVKCENRMLETQKSELEKVGRWFRRRPQIKRRAGFHMTAFHSPWVRWSDILEELISSRGYPERERAFKNTRLAEGDSVVIDRAEPDELHAKYRDSGYTRGQVPDDVAFLVAFCDVQHNRLELEIAGFGANSVLTSIDYRVLLGDVFQPTVWAQLSEVLKERFPTISGKRQLPILKLGIDSGDGNTTAMVYAFYLRHANRVFIFKGRRALRPGQHFVSPASRVDYAGKKIPLYNTDTNAIKTEIFSRFKRAPGDPGEFRFPSDYPASYFAMYAAEEKTVDRHGREVWDNPHKKRNEAFDCRVGVLAIGEILRVDTTSPETWKQLTGAV